VEHLGALELRSRGELGLEELGLNSVLAIEWAEKLPRPIGGAIEVRIDHGDADTRRLTISQSVDQSRGHQIAE